MPSPRWLHSLAENDGAGRIACPGGLDTACARGYQSPPTVLSNPSIPVNERLIVALDMPDSAGAKALVETLGDDVVFYKLGFELFLAGAYPEFLGWLADRGKKCFVDLKFYDVPRTVAAAVRQLERRGAAFCTVHGDDAILRAAVAERKTTKILAVTVLTSLDRAGIESLGFKGDVGELVLSRARGAVAAGCDGVIASGQEAERLRAVVPPAFRIVTPGIRPAENKLADDQKRTVDVEEAFQFGADHIVVGRPIVGAKDPKAAAADHQRRIHVLFKAGR